MSRNGYLLALIHGRGDRRYDLNGQPAGTVTMEERAEAQKRLNASTKRGQDQAERVRTHKEREEKQRQQREIERKNREAKAARKAEHERVQREIARKAALLAQGIVPESRAERKRRLIQEAAERATRGPHAQTVSRDTKSVRFHPHSGPVSAQPGSPERATIKPTPGRPPASPGERPEQFLDQVRTPPVKPMPPVEFRRRRRFVPPPNSGKND